MLSRRRCRRAATCRPASSDRLGSHAARARARCSRPRGCGRTTTSRTHGGPGSRGDPGPGQFRLRLACHAGLTRDRRQRARLVKQLFADWHFPRALVVGWADWPCRSGCRCVVCRGSDKPRTKRSAQNAIPETSPRLPQNRGTEYSRPCRQPGALLGRRRAGTHAPEDVSSYRRTAVSSLLGARHPGTRERI